MDLRAYYARHFPCEALLDWLAYDAAPRSLPLRNRGWMAERARAGGGTFKQRNMRVSHDAGEWRAWLVAAVPLRLDLDAQLRLPPPLGLADSLDAGASAAAKLLERPPHAELAARRELTFDLDANDYAAVRRCGCGDTSAVCGACWPLIVCSARLLDAALRGLLGVRHVLWAFSGSRGLHAHVCDAWVHGLRDDARAGVLRMLDRALAPPRVAPADFGPGLAARLEAGVVAPLAAGRLAAHGLGAASSLGLLRPRVDVPITTQLGHTLKLPFCVHPGTGRLALPVALWDRGLLDLAELHARCPVLATAGEAAVATAVARGVAELEALVAGLRAEPDGRAFREAAFEPQ